MRIQIPLVVEMNDSEVAAYVAEYGLPHHEGPLRTKDVVDDVRANVLGLVQGSLRANVSIKR